MSSTRHALESMSMSIEALEESSAQLRSLAPALVVDAEMVERIRRRLENAAAQTELDRLSIARLDERSSRDAASG